MRRILTIAVLLSLLSSALAADVPNEKADLPQNSAPDISEMFEGTVTSVFDADYIEIDGVKHHLAGVVAPRRWWWGKPRDCYSVQAATYLEQELKNHKVRYAIAPTIIPPTRIEKRVQGPKRIYLYLDDRLINRELVETGYAMADRVREYPEKDEFMNLEAAANLHMLRLWHHCPVECDARNVCRPREWDRQRDD